ncbi:MAG: ATP-binding protein [Thermodesulfobacteriota bacterium]
MQYRPVANPAAFAPVSGESPLPQAGRAPIAARRKAARKAGRTAREKSNQPDRSAAPFLPAFHPRRQERRKHEPLPGKPMPITPAQFSGRQRIPPLLAVATVGLLTVIIVAFALNNLQRERRHLEEGLLRKGRDIIHFIGASTRTTIATGNPTREQLQTLLEQSADNPDIAYIYLADRNGRLLAHSNPDEPPLPEKHQARTDNREWRIIEADTARIFEVSRSFDPLQWLDRKRHRRHMMPPMAGRHPPGRAMAGCDNPDFCRLFGLPAPDSGEGAPVFIHVGLKMADFTATVRQNHLQILIMSAILLLVGTGGYLYLMTAQGLESSRETLAHMQAFLGLLVRKLPSGIIATDGDGIINTFNSKAEELTGIDGRQALHRQPAAVLPPELRNHLQAGSLEETIDLELTLQRPEGDYAIVSINAMPIVDHEGRVQGRTLLLHDLTRQKEMEQRFRRHERHAALGKMAAGLAHELRNPLSSIKGFATLLGNGQTEGEKGKQVAAMLKSEVERLNRGITELLDFARPLPLKPAATDPLLLIGDALLLIEADAGAVGVEIRKQLEELPAAVTVEVDRDRMRQVLLNLLLNAVQAMPAGGILTVAARIGPPGWLELRVSDTGAGIAPENLERVLDPYFTTKAQGTGLGLAMANRIVDEHGGRLHLESAPGRGTTAIVSLPLGGFFDPSAVQ